MRAPAQQFVFFTRISTGLIVKQSIPKREIQEPQALGGVWGGAPTFPFKGGHPMTEQEAIEKIHSVYPTGCKNGLENMRALMAKLGNPQERLTMVHVAGTNGKGSCCAMTERVLRAAGYKTGLYTSPYIEVYNERIRLNGEPHCGRKAGRTGGKRLARGGGMRKRGCARHRVRAGHGACLLLL